MLKRIRATYHYSDIKDLLINYQPANQIFNDLTDLDLLQSPISRIIAKLGYHSIRRGHTVLEKEKGKVPISDRDARNLRYLSVFGDLD